MAARARKQRTALKIATTKLLNSTEQVIKEMNKRAITILLVKLQQKREAISEVNEEINSATKEEELDEDDLLKEIEYDEKLLEACTDLSKILKEQMNNSIYNRKADNGTETMNDKKREEGNVKLPKIEMPEDFSGELHDLPADEKEESNDESDEDEVDEEELDKKMGDVGEEADKLDEKLWGSDSEEENAEEMSSEEYGPGDGKQYETQLMAKDDNKDKREGDEQDDKGNEETNEAEQEPQENPFDESECDDEKTDKYYDKDGPMEQEVDPLELAENLQLDKDEDGKDSDEEETETTEEVNEKGEEEIPEGDKSMEEITDVPKDGDQPTEEDKAMDVDDEDGQEGENPNTESVMNVEEEKEEASQEKENETNYADKNPFVEAGAEAADKQSRDASHDNARGAEESEGGGANDTFSQSHHEGMPPQESQQDSFRRPRKSNDYAYLKAQKTQKRPECKNLRFKFKFLLSFFYKLDRGRFDTCPLAASLIV